VRDPGRIVNTEKEAVKVSDQASPEKLRKEEPSGV
jgi:hypothetical protein